MVARGSVMASQRLEVETSNRNGPISVLKLGYAMTAKEFP